MSCTYLVLVVDGKTSLITIGRELGMELDWIWHQKGKKIKEGKVQPAKAHGPGVYVIPSFF